MVTAGKSLLKEVETSLINFLLHKKEVEDKVNGGYRRVRGLIFGLKKNNMNKYVFTVQIGMCVCEFNVQNGLKEKGSIWGLERLIRDWYERPSVREALKNCIYNDAHKTIVQQTVKAPN